MSGSSLGLSAESLFLAVAQIGLAIGGFAGLLTSFWPSEHSRALRRSPALRIVLDFSFAALAFGLLPFVTYYLMGDDAVSLKVCSLLLAAFILIELSLWAARIKRGLRILHPGLFYGIFVLFNASVAIAGISNFLSSAPLKIYALAILWLLVPPVMQLYLFIVDQDRYLSSIRRRLRRRKADREAKNKAV